MRVKYVLVVLLLAGCSLDFDALERGRGDAGHDLDASRIDGAANDAAARDTGLDAPASPDAHVSPDGSGGDDAATVADTGADAFTPIDAFVPDDVGTDAPLACPVLDCADPTCLGRTCDDGLVCTGGDVCNAAGHCAGTPVSCPTNECATMVCTEPAGCHAGAALADGSVCGGGRCCFGRCSNLQESGNCAGCGLGCDEETCAAGLPTSCICVTNSGCPLGQICTSGRCVCSSNGQCATGQTCSGGRCIY